MQTTLLFKTDKKLKEAAQATAKKLGIPISAVLNNSLKTFVESQEITLSAESYTPTPYLIKILEEGEKNLREGKVKRYDSAEALFADLK